ncbi:MAG: hypothetical protein QXY40_08465 [Candidatus Methanomethylicia archaeon]
MPTFLLDISSSIINMLGGSDLCVNFYNELLTRLVSIGVVLYTFPALNYDGMLERIVFDRNRARDIANRICNPMRARGTPLIRGISSILAQEQNINTFIILSDMLSDRSDDPNMIESLVNNIRSINIRLKLIYIRRRPSPIETTELAIRLLQSLLGEQVCGELRDSLERLRCLLIYMYNNVLIDCLLIINDIANVVRYQLDYFLQEIESLVNNSRNFIEL